MRRGAERPRGLGWLLAGVLLGLGGGCEPADAGSEHVTVFAAASLAASFDELAVAFERDRPGVGVELHCAGTPQLVLQLREGARASVFAAADEASMQRVVDGGLTAGAPQVFATNGLAIVVASGNPKRITGLGDLARAGLKVALCGAEVPAGRYARQALAQAGVDVQSVSDEPSVTAVVNKVKLGELDAGIVYRTDTRREGVAAVAIAAERDVARYPIAVLANAPAADLATAFVAFVQSAAGRRILAAHGFGAP